MLNFLAKVINTEGEVVTLEVGYESLKEATSSLEREGFTILSIKRSATSSSKLKHKEVLDFTGTLSILLDSNLSLKEALAAGIEGRKEDRIKKLFSELSYGLNRGESFSSIISMDKWGLSSLYRGLIKVGEKTGNLKIVLRELNSYLDREKKLRDKINSALIYPIFILIVSILFSMVFIFVVLPQFKEMFSSFGADISDLLNQRATSFTIFVFSFLLLLLTIGLVSIYQRRLRKESTVKASKLDRFILNIPRVKDILINSETLNFLFALKVLSSSKLQIEESLLFSKSVLKNAYLQLQVEDIANKITKGSKLSNSFRESIFPNRVASFLQVGEETGNLTEILENLSNYYLTENSKLLDMVTALIDPLFTLLIGSFIMVLIIMFVLPLLTQLGGLF